MVIFTLSVLRKLGLVLFIAGLSQSAMAQLAPQKTVILIPGFFNSATSNYFSDRIVQLLKSQNLNVVVPTGMNPVGTIEENGEHVLKILNQVRATYPNTEINIIAHSAGGLYSLYAINHGAYFVNQLITMSTPYDGLEFIEAWRKYSTEFSLITDISYIQGLRQLTKPYVRKFLATVKVPRTLKVYAYGGHQPRSIEVLDAENLPAPFLVPAAFTTGDTDGIVSFQSSTETTLIRTLEKTFIKVQSEKKLFIALDHWEQVIDYNHFTFLGIQNTQVVQDRQSDFYLFLAQQIIKNQQTGETL